MYRDALAQLDPSRAREVDEVALRWGQGHLIGTDIGLDVATLSGPQAADLCGLAPLTLAKNRRSGLVKATLGADGQWYYRRDELIAYMKAKGLS